MTWRWHAAPVKGCFLLGRTIPAGHACAMTDVAQTLADTDWHLDQVYGFADSLGASVLQATHSRYVIDLNRPANDESLYPGQTTTALCPSETFRGEPLYRDPSHPEPQDVASRLERYWRPYHRQLERELARHHAEHGAVLLWEAHSIASVLPRLFEGKLPDLNLGTASGKSCGEEVLLAVEDSLRDCPYTWVANGRFKGGYITRHYGKPGRGVHAIQLEMCQSIYMNRVGVSPPTFWPAP